MIEILFQYPQQFFIGSNQASLVAVRFHR